MHIKEIYCVGTVNYGGFTMALTTQKSHDVNCTVLGTDAIRTSDAIYVSDQILRKVIKIAVYNLKKKQGKIGTDHLHYLNNRKKESNKELVAVYNYRYRSYSNTTAVTLSTKEDACLSYYGLSHFYAMLKPDCGYNAAAILDIKQREKNGMQYHCTGS